MVKRDIENRADIEALVNAFYLKVEKDDVIRHFFTDVVKLDWSKHIPVMYDFWESILLNTHNYKGNPMPAHVSLNEKSPMKKEHFDRWIQLFSATIDELFQGEKAEQAKTRALSIATVMQIKMIQKSK
ncbi:MAG: group III truncated hemoglobin [Bacteroidetes bacterium]|nr:group III truncated hemoglobin [Bacteroidota bacterium]